MEKLIIKRMDLEWLGQGSNGFLVFTGEVSAYKVGIRTRVNEDWNLGDRTTNHNLGSGEGAGGWWGC